eukprot:1151839-Pelagomonas_calceolata.AAC.2
MGHVSKGIAEFLLNMWQHTLKDIPLNVLPTAVLVLLRVRLSEAMCEQECMMAAATAANSVQHMVLKKRKEKSTPAVGLNKVFCRQRAGVACPNFIFGILDMTPAISVQLSPPEIDLEHENGLDWLNIDSYLTIYAWNTMKCNHYKDF